MTDSGFQHLVNASSGLTVKDGLFVFTEFTFFSLRKKKNQKIKDAKRGKKVTHTHRRRVFSLRFQLNPFQHFSYTLDELWEIQVQ